MFGVGFYWRWLGDVGYGMGFIRGKRGIYVLGWGLLGGGLWVCDFLTSFVVMKWKVGVLEVGLWGGLGIALGWGLEMGWVLARGFVWGLRVLFQGLVGGFLGG